MPRLVAVVALCLALSAAPALAGPADDVLRMVPANATLCVVVRDLSGHSTRVLESPFADWFRKSELGRAVLEHDALKKLRDAEKNVTTQLGLTRQDIRDDIFGDAVAFAYTAGHGDKAEAEAGVLIGKARKPDTLAKLIRNFNAVQTKSGELKQVHERAHLGLPYFEREKTDGGKEFYFTRDDGLFAYSAQESALRAVLFMDHRVKERDGIPNPKFLTTFTRLGVEKVAAVLLFDPRTFDAELAAKAKASADPNEKSFLTQFGKLWAATDAVGVSLTLDRDAELAVNVAFDKAKVPAELRTLLETDGGSTALWSVVPKNAMFAVAGRFDLAKSAQAFQSFISEDSKEGLRKLTTEGVAPVVGKDTLPKLLTNLGPDWGLWFTPPEAVDKSHLPVATFALRVRAAGSTDTSVGDAILTGLDFVSQILRVEYNKGHDDQFMLSDEKHDGGTVKFLKNDKALPTGVRPAYGLRGDFLVLASHPDAVKRFTPPTADAKVTNAPLVRVSAKAIVGYLKAQRTGLCETFGRWTGEKPAAFEQKMTEFATVLELLDRVELHHTADAGRTKLALRVTLTEPLRK